MKKAIARRGEPNFPFGSRKLTQTQATKEILAKVLRSVHELQNRTVLRSLRRNYMSRCRCPLFVVLLLSGCNSDRLAELEKQNRELTAKLESSAKSVSLDLQAKCSAQARLEYSQSGFEKEQMANYTNHYNAKLNKCFMEIRSSQSYSKPYVPTESRTVSDAFEGKVYGEYFWRNNTKKKYWEVPPFQCKVTLPTGEEVICKSPEEFESLTKQYMAE